MRRFSLASTYLLDARTLRVSQIHALSVAFTYPLDSLLRRPLEIGFDNASNYRGLHQLDCISRTSNTDRRRLRFLEITMCWTYHIPCGSWCASDFQFVRQTCEDSWKPPEICPVDCINLVVDVVPVAMICCRCAFQYFGKDITAWQDELERAVKDISLRLELVRGYRTLAGEML